MSAKTIIKVGDVVRIRFGRDVAFGEVIEDRGPIGVGGRRLYRIRYSFGPEFTTETEMPADSFEVDRELSKKAAKVGDTVRFMSDSTAFTGRVIEYRGLIDGKGRRIYRIRFPLSLEFTAETEMPADAFEVIQDEKRVS